MLNDEGDRKKDDTPLDGSCSIEPVGCKRYVIAWLSCLGLTIIFAMRSEIGLAIIALTADKNVLRWTPLQIGIFEAASFIGKTFFGFASGILATHFPGNHLLGAAIFTACFFNIILPFVLPIKSLFAVVAIIRIVQGMGEGCIYSCLIAFWRFWAPDLERSKLVTISYFGIGLGPIFGFPISGYIIQNLGWQYVFYFFGILGVAWSVIWIVVVREKPEDDWCISAEEVEYIQATVLCKDSASCCNIPWKGILTSLPVLAIIAATFGRNWTFQFSLVGLPVFYHDVYNVTDNFEISLHMVSPFVLMAVCTPTAGWLADYIRKRRCLSTKNARKLFNNIGLGITAVCLTLAGFMPNMYAATTLLSFAIGSLGIAASGYGVNPIDISPHYGGVLMGMASGLGTLAGVISPIIASVITKDRLRWQWAIVFIISAGISLFAVVCFTAFAQGDVQAWDDTTQSSKPLSQASDNVNYGATEKGALP